MAKLKRLKGFSEFVKRLKQPRKNDSKKIRLKKTDQIVILKKRAKNYQNENFFRTKNISERKIFFESVNFREN